MRSVYLISLITPVRDNEGVRRSNRRFRIGHFAALVASAVACAAQESSTIALSNGARIEVTAGFGHPTGEETLTVEMARASGNSFYRIFWDQNHLAVYAYELALDLAPGGDRVLAAAKPAEEEFASHYPNADAGKPVPTLSEVHDLGPLGSGQSATLGLFEIPGVGLAVSETLQVKLNQSGGTGGPLRLAGIQVFADKNAGKGTERELVSGPAPKASVAGRYVMFYIPGRGAYFFSAEPVSDRAFVEAGSVDHNQMDFSIDNEAFHVTADAPILTQPESGDVWVYHDPAYKPSGNWTLDLTGATTAQSAENAFFTAASDSLSWWLE